MQQRFTLRQSVEPTYKSKSNSPTPSEPLAKKAPEVKPPVSDAELARIFNTALVSAQAGDKKRNLSAEACELNTSPAFKVILNAVKQHAQIRGVSERQAAEELIQTFRSLDELWREYVIREGLSRLQGPKGK